MKIDRRQKVTLWITNLWRR